MKNLLMLVPVFLFTICLAYSQQYKDVVHIKNGSVMHGSIIGQIPNEAVKMKTKDSDMFVYKTGETEKMKKEEVKIGKKDSKTIISNTFQKQSGLNHSGFGIRGGIGTDITGGLGFGVGAFYIPSSSNWDLGLDIYYANISETETGTDVKRNDNTKLLVFAFRSNYLINYNPKKSGVYFLAGAGFVLSSVSWKETITYDPIRYPNIGPEHWSDDALSFGNVLNLGVGLKLGGGLETRLETPLLIFYGTPGHGSQNAGTIAPTFTLNLLYRFP